MRFQELTNARFQDRDATRRSDAAAVHDADAAMRPAPAGLEETASALIANQCDAQLDLLIDTTRVPG